MKKKCCILVTGMGQERTIARQKKHRHDQYEEYGPP
jgi:hypothetical protein